MWRCPTSQPRRAEMVSRNLSLIYRNVRWRNCTTSTTWLHVIWPHNVEVGSWVISSIVSLYSHQRSCDGCCVVCFCCFCCCCCCCTVRETTVVTRPSALPPELGPAHSLRRINKTFTLVRGSKCRCLPKHCRHQASYMNVWCHEPVFK